MNQVPLDDDMVDLQTEEINEGQEGDVNEALISSSSLSCSVYQKKILAGIIVMLVIVVGVVSLVVWQTEKSSFVPTPTPTIPPGPAPVPTVRPVPEDASNMTAESLLYTVFDKNQLCYTEILCLPQSPPTYKFMLQVENFANFTGESNTKEHAKVVVSRQATEVMFGLNYDDKTPMPPAPQACQVL